MELWVKLHALMHMLLMLLCLCDLPPKIATLSSLRLHHLILKLVTVAACLASFWVLLLYWQCTSLSPHYLGLNQHKVLGTKAFPSLSTAVEVMSSLSL